MDYTVAARKPGDNAGSGQETEVTINPYLVCKFSAYGYTKDSNILDRLALGGQMEDKMKTLMLAIASMLLASAVLGDCGTKVTGSSATSVTASERTAPIDWWRMARGQYSKPAGSTPEKRVASPGDIELYEPSSEMAVSAAVTSASVPAGIGGEGRGIPPFYLTDRLGNPVLTWRDARALAARGHDWRSIAIAANLSARTGVSVEKILGLADRGLTWLQIGTKLRVSPREFLDVSAYPYSREKVTSGRHEERLGKQHAALASQFGVPIQPMGAGVGAGAAGPSPGKSVEMEHRTTSPPAETVEPTAQPEY